MPRVIAAEDTLAYYLELQLDKIKDAKGFLIDVRDNGGGNSNNSNPKTTEDPDIRMMYEIKNRIHYQDNTHNKHIMDRPATLGQPVVILANAGTYSAAEDFLIDFDTCERATIVGTASYGSTGQPLFGDLPGGGKYGICKPGRTAYFKRACQYCVIRYIK